MTQSELESALREIIVGVADIKCQIWALQNQLGKLRVRIKNIESRELTKTGRPIKKNQTRRKDNI